MRVEKMLRVTGGHGQSLDSWPSEQSLSPLHLPAPRGDPLPIVKACILSPLLWEPANAARKRLTAGRVSGVSPMARGLGESAAPACRLQEAPRGVGSGHQDAAPRRPEGAGPAASAGTTSWALEQDARSKHFVCLFLDAFVLLRPEKDRVQY